MKWTKTKPTKPGWYWARNPSLNIGQAVVEAYTVLSRIFISDQPVVAWVDSWEWSDEPIPEPEEVK